MRKKLLIRDWVKLRTRVSKSLTLGLITVWVSASGCSLGGLFGNGKDEGVLKTTSYRKINPDCGFKSDSPELDVPTFRSVLKCFNANHAMDRIVALFDQLTDQELQPIVNAGNQYVLNNPKRLYEIEKTHSALKAEGIADESFKQFGKLIENGEFISNAIALLKEGIFVPATSINPSAHAGLKVPDPELLKALELIGSGFDNQTIEKTIATSLNVSGAASFQDLHRNFKQGLRSTPSLRMLTDGVFSYLKTQHTYSCDARNPSLALREEFFDLLRNKYLIEAFENTFDIQAPLRARGSSKDPLKERVAEISLILEALSRDGGLNDELIKKLGAAFQRFNEPFFCLKQGVAIENPTLLIVKELVEKQNEAIQSGRNVSEDLARYILRDNPLNFTLLQEPICQLPTKDLQVHYSTLKDLALLNVTYPGVPSKSESFLTPMTGLLKSAYEYEKPWLGCDKKSPAGNYRPLFSFLTHFMSDLDPSLGMRNQSHSKKKGLDYLIPLFKEFSSRDVWTDLLLVATVPGDQDRKNFEKFGKFLVDQQPQLNNKSIAEVVLNSLERTTHPLQFFQFVWSLRNYVNLEDNFLEESLLRVREAYYINNVHPVTDLVSEVLKNSTKNADLITSIFALSGELKSANGVDVKNYFSEALEEIAEMAKDGRLNELLDAVISINSRFAAKAQNEVKIQTAQVSPFVPSRRHNFQRSDIPRLKVNSRSPFSLARFNVPQECDLLDYSVSLRDSQNVHFDTQLNAFLSCLNGNSTHYDDLIDGIKILRSKPLASRAYLGSTKSLYDLTFDLASDLLISPPAHNDKRDFEFLKDSWLSFYQNSNRPFYRLLDGFTLLVEGVPPGAPLPARAFGPILAPLMKVGGELVSSTGDSLKEMQAYGAQVLRGPTFPKLLADLHSISNAKATPPPVPANLNPTSDPFVDNVLKKAWNGPVGRPFNDQFINTVKDWVHYKECDGLPLGAAAREAELELRVVRILNEARDNVNNWEWIYNSSTGKDETRKKWDVSSLKNWVEPILNKMTDPSGSSPTKLLREAQIDFFKYFSHPLKKKHFHWQSSVWPQYSPDWLVNWFYERSIDYRPILYMYPGATYPVVRIVNTLDLFELVTLNSDFMAPPPISENLGMRNLSILAEAWGDVPVWERPSEIQDKYRKLGKEPLTIAEAVKEMMSPSVAPPSWDPRTWGSYFLGAWGSYFLELTGVKDLETLTRLYIGLPAMPGCMRPVLGEVRLPDVNLLSSIVSSSYFLDLAKHRDKIFNLWQTRAVMEDNIPGNTPSPGTDQNGYRTTYDGGLEFFRNFFFQLLYSSPESARDFNYDILASNDANNLTVVSYSNRIGMLKIVSKLLQNVRGDDPALKDVFYTLVHASKTPELMNLLNTLFSDPRGRDVIENVIFSILKVVNEGSEDEINQMKEMGYYLIASLNRLNPWEPPTPKKDRSSNPHLLATPPTQLLPLLFKNLDLILKDKENLKFLRNENNEFLIDLMTSRPLASFAQQLYSQLGNPAGGVDTAKRMRKLIREFLNSSGSDHKPLMNHGLRIARGVYQDSVPSNGWETRENWRDFFYRADALSHTTPFKNLNLEDALLPILLFFEESDLDSNGQVRSQEDKDFAQRLRKNFADILEAGKLDDLLLFAKNDPNEFDQILRMGVKYLGTGNLKDLEEFFKVLNGRLSAPVR